MMWLLMFHSTSIQVVAKQAFPYLSAAAEFRDMLRRKEMICKEMNLI